MKKVLNASSAILMLSALLLPFSAHGATLELTASDNAKQIAVANGADIVVRLDGNPTTGFRWELQKIEGPLKQIGAAKYESGAAPGMVGAGGTYTFRFRATAVGNGAIKLVYHRPWEKNVPPAKTFSVTATVGEAEQR